MPKATTLSCGGKGPCCHVGYSHRHCEHCDMVIDTRSYTYIPYINPVPTYPTYPYWWTNGTYNTFGDVGNANFGIGIAAAAPSAFNTQIDYAASTAPTTWDHTCAALTAGD